MPNSPVVAMDPKSFYDDYVEHQTAVGVNERHHAILKWMRQAGLDSHHRVLEIGCGVGTLTELLALELAPYGSVLGVDLSPKSIEAARSRLAGRTNVTFAPGDVLELDLDDRFDVVVLPDVIEHIPLENHPRLFGRLASWVAPDGFVLLNYPDPHYLQWCAEHKPGLLQVIDQPIHANVMLANAYPSGLYLDFLRSYSIWIEEGDYVVAVLRPTGGRRTFTTVPQAEPSLLGRAVRRVRRLTR